MGEKQKKKKVGETQSRKEWQKEGKKEKGEKAIRQKDDEKETPML